MRSEMITGLVTGADWVSQNKEKLRWEKEKLGGRERRGVNDGRVCYIQGQQWTLRRFRAWKIQSNCLRIWSLRKLWILDIIRENEKRDRREREREVLLFFEMLVGIERTIHDLGEFKLFVNNNKMCFRMSKVKSAVF